MEKGGVEKGGGGEGRGRRREGVEKGGVEKGEEGQEMENKKLVTSPKMLFMPASVREIWNHTRAEMMEIAMV